jgi:hypothetical protein
MNCSGAGERRKCVSRTTQRGEIMTFDVRSEKDDVSNVALPPESTVPCDENEIVIRAYEKERSSS